MKIFLGALTAAVLMGVGCAHNREASKQTEPPRSAQASVEGIQTVPGYSCQVVDSSASGTASGTAQSQSPTLGSESQGGAVSGGALEGNATGGGLAADEGAVSGGDLGGNAIGGSALGEAAASGSAQSGDALGGSGSEESPAPVVEQKDTATSDAAPKKDAFEDTGMGGGGGGGG